jgi:bifunctional DNase/RNase
VEPAEADAIALKLQNVPTARPLIHDLLCSLIQAFGGKVRLAVIHDFHKDTYFAKLVLGIRRKNFEFDCRPSDAIAVALRVKAPICVESSILDKFGTSIHQIGEFH